jgi:plasmid stabilization system protein ParE
MHARRRSFRKDRRTHQEMKPEFHPAAEEELTSAALSYEDKVLGLGADLAVEVRRLVNLLCDTPRIGERLDERHRRFPLQRFPFAVIFRVDGDLLRIVAVAHRRRRPGYWRERK